MEAGGIDIKTLDVYQHIYSNYYHGGSSIYDHAISSSTT